jgi:hypothetical protein
MPPKQGQLVPGAIQFETGTPCVRQIHEQPGSIANSERAIKFGSALLNNSQGFRLLSAIGYARHAGFEYAAFFGGNFGDCAAKDAAMVNGNFCDDSESRLVDDICGIPPAAQAGFQHNIVAALPGKIQKRQGSNKLKFRYLFRQAFRSKADFFR